MECDSKSQFFRSRHTQPVYPMMTYWVLKVYRLDYTSCCILSHEMSNLGEMHTLSYHKYWFLYLNLSLPQAKKVSKNQKKLLFKKNRLSTAASTLLIIQLFKWFSSALASTYPHLSYFQKSNLFSKDKIYYFGEESIFIWLNTFRYDC